MHQQMTYPEIAALFKKFDTYLEDERLSFYELDCYYHSLANDPLLEVMIDSYPPFSQKVKSIIEKSVNDYQYQDNPSYQKIQERKKIRARKKLEQAVLHVMRTHFTQDFFSADFSEDFKSMLNIIDENMGTPERLNLRLFDSLNSDLKNQIVTIGNFIKTHINQPDIFEPYEPFEQLIGAGSRYHDNPNLLNNPYWQKLSDLITDYNTRPHNQLTLRRGLAAIMRDITEVENPEALLTSEESVATRLLAPFLVRDDHDNILPTKAFYQWYRLSAGLDLPENHHRRRLGEYRNDLETHRLLREQTAFGAEHIAILLSALRDNNASDKEQLELLRFYDERFLSHPENLFLDSSLKWDEAQALSHYERYIRSGKDIFMSFEIPALNIMKRERFFKEFGNAVKPTSILELQSSLSLRLIDRVVSQCQDLPILYNTFLYSMKFGGTFFETRFNNAHKIYSTSSISRKSVQININDFERDMRDFFKCGIKMAIQENKPYIFARLIDAGYLNALYQYQENPPKGIEKGSPKAYKKFLTELIQTLCEQGQTQMLAHLLKSEIPGFKDRKELKSYLQKFFLDAITRYPLPPLTAFQSSGVSVNFTRNNDTPLIAAIRTGDAQKIDVVLNSRSAVKIINKRVLVGDTKLTPIMFAASQGNLDAIALLIEYGAKFDANELITQYGANFNRENLISCILQHTSKYSEDYLRSCFCPKICNGFFSSNVFNTFPEKNSHSKNNHYLDLEDLGPRILSDDPHDAPIEYSPQSSPRRSINP